MFTKKPKSTAWEATVQEAITIIKNAAPQASYGDARDEKLSVKGYLNEALRNAGRGMTAVKLRLLDERLAGKVHPLIDEFTAEVFRRAVATRVDQGCCLRPPSGNLHLMLAGYYAERWPLLLIETQLHATNPFELVALACLQATERHPEAFGVIDDWDAHEAQHEATGAKLRGLYERIGEEWTAADIVVCESDGFACFAWQGEATPVCPVPRVTAGERLIAYLVNREAERKAA